MTTAPFLRDLTRIHARTRRHSAEGTAAASGAEGLATLLRLLNDILESELLWLLRYRRRYLMQGGQRRVSSVEPAREEPTPADRVATRIVELGGRPDLDPDDLLSRSRADYAARGSLGNRIREDLQAERIVIESYTEVIDYLGAADPRTRVMLEVNRGRERARAMHLSEILHDLEAPHLGEVG